MRNPVLFGLGWDIPDKDMLLRGAVHCVMLIIGDNEIKEQIIMRVGVNDALRGTLPLMNLSTLLLEHDIIGVIGSIQGPDPQPEIGRDFKGLNQSSGLNVPNIKLSLVLEPHVHIVGSYIAAVNSFQVNVDPEGILILF